MATSGSAGKTYPCAAYEHQRLTDKTCWQADEESTGKCTIISNLRYGYSLFPAERHSPSSVGWVASPSQSQPLYRQTIPVFRVAALHDYDICPGSCRTPTILAPIYNTTDARSYHGPGHRKQFRHLEHMLVRGVSGNAWVRHLAGGIIPQPLLRSKRDSSTNRTPVDIRNV